MIDLGTYLPPFALQYYKEKRNQNEGEIKINTQTLVFVFIILAVKITEVKQIY